jgi:glutamate synthase domain-containing protein 1
MALSVKDSCGVGFIASISGEKSYGIIDKGLKAVSNLTHRGAALSDGRTGTVQVFFSKFLMNFL